MAYRSELNLKGQSVHSLKHSETQRTSTSIKLRGHQEPKNYSINKLPSVNNANSLESSSPGFISHTNSRSMALGKSSFYQSSPFLDTLKSSSLLNKSQDEQKPIDHKHSKPVRSIHVPQKSLNIDITNEPKSFSIPQFKELSLHTVSNTNIPQVGIKMTAALSSLSSQTAKANVQYNLRTFSPKKNPLAKYSIVNNVSEPLRSSSTLAAMRLESTLSSPLKDEQKQRGGDEPKPYGPQKYLSDHRGINFPHFDPTKCSARKNGIVKAYAANTNQGIVRNYNEDRVAIILNIMKPPNIDSKEDWPICSFFGVYDGHGGTLCADFLRDNLHQYIIRDKNFPFNPVQALKNGFVQAEKQFSIIAQQNSYELDRSGSCAIVVLVVGDCCYVANVGDSRAVMSADQGKTVIELSRDHKPSDEDEKRRILSAGGKIYQSQIPIALKQTALANSSPNNRMILGPVRVLPGRLSVSRTFGDLEAKLPKYGGVPGVVVAEPEIRTFKITKSHDFIILGSDGIYDKVDSEDLVGIIWESAYEKRCSDIHQQSSSCVEALMKESLVRRTLDNITVVMIAFSGFKHMLFPKSKDSSLSILAEKKDQVGISQSLSNEVTTEAPQTNNPTPTILNISKPNVLPPTLSAEKSETTTQTTKNDTSTLVTNTANTNNISTTNEAEPRDSNKTTAAEETRSTPAREIISLKVAKPDFLSTQKTPGKKPLTSQSFRVLTRPTSGKDKVPEQQRMITIQRLVSPREYTHKKNARSWSRGKDIKPIERAELSSLELFQSFQHPKFKGSLKY